MMPLGRALTSDTFIPRTNLGRFRGRSLGEQSRPAQASSSSARPSSDGPESMTLAERFIVAFRLPYALGCVLVGFGLFGILNTVLSKYVETADLRQGVVVALSPQSVAESALFAYSFYVPRYMRTKLLEAARTLPTLLAEKDEGFRKMFRGISAVRPQVATWIVFLAALLIALNVAVAFGGPSTFRFNTDSRFSVLEFLATILDFVSLAVISLAFSSVVWTYWSISSGMRRFS